MRTVLNDPPEVVQTWLARRQALGQDLYDEVWEGTYHVAPAPHPAHGYVDDALAAILRPQRGPEGFQPVDRSALLGISAAELRDAIRLASRRRLTRTRRG